MEQTLSSFLPSSLFQQLFSQIHTFKRLSTLSKRIPDQKDKRRTVGWSCTVSPLLDGCKQELRQMVTQTATRVHHPSEPAVTSTFELKVNNLTTPKALV